MSTLNESWLNVNSASAWPASFSISNTKHASLPVKSTPIQNAFQWSNSWEPIPNSTPINKKVTPPKAKKAENATPEEQETIETLVKPFESITFVNKDQSDNAWVPQQPAKPVENIKKKKQEEKAQIEEELAKQNLYKTELCRSWMDTGACRYGHKCQFAHGEHELRPVLRHPKYKTEVCKTYTNTGTCPYGARCRFIHQQPSEQAKTSPSREEIKPVAITVPIHTPVVITVGSVPSVPQTQLASEDDDAASKKSRLAFFQNLTPAN